MSTKIEWTEETWNPVTGCTRISPGCLHCYIERQMPMRVQRKRFDGNQIGAVLPVQLHPERLRKPLTWRKPRRIFVCSMADLFHDEVPDDYIAQVFTAMACAPQHTFQMLTKRPARMRALLSSTEFQQEVRNFADVLGRKGWDESWPLRNVWAGVSVESQQWADFRIPQLLGTPAAVRWISAEPLVGPLTLKPEWLAPAGIACWMPGHGPTTRDSAALADIGRTALREIAADRGTAPPTYLDWVVVGGETGPGSRPMDPGWARDVRDQCAAAGVPFFYKQTGDWAPAGLGIGQFDLPELLIGPELDDMGHRQIMRRVGKKAAGRELDGRTHDEYPGVVA
ncbi:phage Gp37/Gp68 family protein [Nocardia pseudovaccinii]|uniref:phage Gp37/Gp68 family protein n=1 Tax=Nocardia pseudovaccinii TaxID=189540 RepID=UPI0007A44EAB|nr:phage Gp37/Gp68 family protein [Nocardia pseudovaccinii]